MSKKPFDRSQFKKTVSAEELKAQDEAIEKVAGNQRDNNYAGYHTIEEGVNKFRIYPGHMDDAGNPLPFIAPVQRWWLSVEVEDKDEKTGKVSTKVVRKRVFDGRVHSAIGKDIVDEYIKFLEKILREQGLTQEKIDEQMLPIYGRYSKDPKQRVNGITGKPEWIMFADKIEGSGKVFGKLPIGKAVKIRLDDLIAREGADEPLGSDSTNPFTDPDDGRLLEITYDKSATRPQDYYKTEIDNSFNKETKMVNLVPLRDEDLMAFMEFDSLHKQYIDNYTQADFELAIEGLKNLDEENEFGVFAYDDFLNICEELSTAYPEKAETDEDKEEVDEFDFDSMDRAAMKKFIKANGCGIIVTKDLSDDDIRDRLYDWLDTQEKEVAGDPSVEEPEEPEQEEEEAEEEEEAAEEEEEEETTPQAMRKKAAVVEEEEEEEEEAAPKKMSAAERIAALKKKQGKE